MIPMRKFAKYVNKRQMHPIYIGIDSGSSGAIAFVCGEQYTVVDIPTIKIKRGTAKKSKNKTVFNYPEIIRIFKRIERCVNPVFVALEMALPTKGGPGGAYVAFRVGCNYAMWPLFLISKGYSLQEFMPSSWKGKMQLHGKDKEYSRHMAIRMFPKADLRLKKHHDRAEALLLAEYLKRIRHGRI